MPQKKTTTISTKVSKKPLTPLAWGSVMSQENSAEDKRTRAMATMVAKIYGVPPMGVTILADSPYLNKEGRLFLLNELTKQNPPNKIETEYLSLSTSPTVPAICKKRITFKNGMFVEGIGEAHPNNVKLSAVKNMLNMMAETRALNRTIWEAVAAKVWQRVEKNLIKQNLNTEQTATVIAAGKTSAEEMDQPSDDIKELTLYQKARKIIDSDNRDLKTLERWREMLEISDLYNDAERKELLQIVDRQINSRLG